MPDKRLSILRLISIIVIAIACANCNGSSGNGSDDYKIDCLYVGETAYPSYSLICCDGTKLSTNYMIGSTECISLPDSKICLDCGNGICEDWENRCSCPDDCDPNGCIARGGTLYPNDGNLCCRGLKAEPNYLWDESGECTEVTGVDMEGATVQELICVRCGNGGCEEGENPCICSDCKDDIFHGGDCVDFGEMAYASEGLKCCDGKELLPPYEIESSGNCVRAGYDPRICLNCGDGICEDPENRCSCPDDCDPNGCIGQGEPIDLNAGERCCAYLKHAWNYEWDGNGGCTEVSDVNVEGSTVQQVICVNCGNGICEEGESSCICPSDCGDLACADYGVVPWETAEGDFTSTSIRCCEGLECTTKRACYNKKCINTCQKGGSAGGLLCVCMSCGDGICDKTLESKCNCPKDCM